MWLDLQKTISDKWQETLYRLLQDAEFFCFISVILWSYRFVYLLILEFLLGKFKERNISKLLSVFCKLATLMLGKEIKCWKSVSLKQEFLCVWFDMSYPVVRSFGIVTSYTLCKLIFCKNTDLWCVESSCHTDCPVFGVEVFWVIKFEL